MREETAAEPRPPALSSAGVPRTPLLRSPPTGGGASSDGSLHLRREGVYICTFSLQRRHFAFAFASPVGEGAGHIQYRAEMHFAFASRDSSSVGVSLNAPDIANGTNAP